VSRLGVADAEAGAGVSWASINSRRAAASAAKAIVRVN
jgi:hypothetical protein